MKYFKTPTFLGTAVTSSLCAVYLSKDLQSLVIENPYKARENNEDFKTLSDAVGLDEAVKIVENFSEGGAVDSNLKGIIDNPTGLNQEPSFLDNSEEPIDAER